MNHIVTVTSANSGPLGYNQDPARWRAACVTASHLNILLETCRRQPVELLTGDEFESAKHMVAQIQMHAGVFNDAIHSAIHLDQLIEINKEFYEMARAKT